MSAEPPAADGARERIVKAGYELLTEKGREAVSTRSVSAAAGFQAPVIYRLFGDKQGLLDAVAAYGFTAHLADKAHLEPSDDPVQDLRAGWDMNISFALANPALYALIYGEPHPGSPMPAAQAGRQILADTIRRVAEAARLRISETLATDLLHACGRGVALALVSQPEDQRDPQLSATAREAAIAAITQPAPTDHSSPALHSATPASAAVTMSALLPRTGALSDAERTLMQQWLERIARA